MHYTLTQFTEFLSGIDLAFYRSQYSHIKIVEMDLPKQIQALDTIYSSYWNYEDGSPQPLDFYNYYNYYCTSCLNDISIFWRKSGFGMGCSCFPRGLVARIYRTWASLITQVHAGYVAESVFGAGKVHMSTELDHKNIDILVTRPGQSDLKIQIKKVTHRPEIARRQEHEADEDGIIPIWYVTPKSEDYWNNPYYVSSSRRGELRDSLRDFVRFNPNGTLDMLPNGFVVFTPEVFMQLVRTA